MRLVLAILLSLAFTALPQFTPPARAQAQTCQFVLGFAVLHDMIPDIVGDCLDNVSYNALGNAVQHTTGGTSNGRRGGQLEWRKTDGLTAFTDGYRTWLNGPFGLQVRYNAQVFWWEYNPNGLPITPPPVPGDRCHTAGLSLSLLGVDAGAGNFVGTFAFKNNLSVPCTFNGYVGAQLADAMDEPLPTNVVRGGGVLASLPGPSTVTVPAGGTATFMMHWEDVPVGGEATCPTASFLKVTPPNEYDPVVIRAQITACGGGRLDVSAVAPGAGATSTASTDVSRNWSGYLATGGTYTAVSGTWTVAQPANTGSPTASATWVGIGGVTSRDLIQAGTDDVTDGAGGVQYEAWIETLPQPPQQVPLVVRGGDSVTVSLTYRGSRRWLISLTNNTTRRSYQTTVVYTSSLSSAEWIEEAPSTRRQVLPLDAFGTVRFTGASTVVGGRRLTIAQAGGQAVTMLDFRGNALAVPSPLGADGASFSVSRVGP